MKRIAITATCLLAYAACALMLMDAAHAYVCTAMVGVAASKWRA